MIKREVSLIGVDGKGRVAEDNACAHRHGGGAWAIDLKIPLLRQWQHETCDPLALRSRPMGANRGFSILTASCERRYRRALIRVSFTRVSARFAWPSAVLLEGGGTGPKRPGPERGTTGTLTVSNILHTAQNLGWQAKLCSLATLAHGNAL